jgi:WD40 repeat protein
MTPEDYERMWLVFDEAQQCQPEQRSALLDQRCAGNPELRNQLALLLALGSAPPDFLAEPCTLRIVYAAPGDPDPLIGRQVGHYEIEGVLGGGGMGIVYRAVRREPYQQKVALKIIRPELAGPEVLRRFNLERQVLANLRHRNIAQLLDGGTLDNRPYLVMEYIDGKRIDWCCVDQGLTDRARVQLFRQVCAAVQCAHQNLVLHRDLKPGNIVVGADGVPKLLDFGIAQLLDRESATQTGFQALTPEYSSPEQLRGVNNLTVASDVYALGVVLYEVLTGHTPHQVPGKVVNEVERKRAGLPPTPLREWQRKVPADLETICLKCLENEPKDRYGSAEALTEDLDHFLMEEPLRWARKVGTWERIRKWARRRPAVAALTGFACLAVLSILGLGGGHWYNAEKRAQAVQSLGEAEEQLQDVGGKLEVTKRQLVAQEELLVNKQKEVQEVIQRGKDTALRYQYLADMLAAPVAWETNNLERLRTLLRKYGPGSGNEKIRGFEWYYFARLCHAEVHTLGGHADTVTSVAYSPDGRFLASASGGGPGARVDKPGELKVWEAQTGKAVRTVASPSSINAVAFSPDGKLFASASRDKTVRLWKADTWEGPFSLNKGHTDIVTSVVFSPESKLLASGGALGEVILWDVNDVTAPKPVYTFDGRHGRVWSVAFSPDGAHLASANHDNAVTIWEVATRKLVRRLPHTNHVTSVAYSPDGMYLVAASMNGRITVWDTSGRMRLDFLGHQGANGNCVAFSPDGRYLVSGNLGPREPEPVKLWDAATGQQMLTFRGQPGHVTSVAFSPDGKHLAAGGGGQGKPGDVKIWDATINQEVHTVSCLPLHSPRPSTFSPDGKRVVVWNNSFIAKPSEGAVWDVATGEKLLALEGHGEAVYCVAYSPDGRFLASGSAAAARPGEVRVWDAATGKKHLTFKGHASWINGVAFSPDGKYLASASNDKTVKVWNTDSGKERAALKGHTDEVNCVAFSPDGKKLASGSSDKTVRVWNTESGKELFTLKSNAGGVSSVVFSPEGKRLASAGTEKGMITIWDADTRRELYSLQGHASGVTSIAFSPDGRRLASGSLDQTVKLWDLSTGGEALLTLRGHTDAVKCVAFSSSDGRHLASASSGGDCKVWDGGKLNRGADGVLPEIAKKVELARHRREAESSEGGRQWFGAVFHLNRLIDAEPKNGLFRARRAYAHAGLGRWDKAATDYDRVIALKKDWPALCYHNALVQWQAGGAVKYRNACTHMVERFAGQTDHRDTAVWLARASTLVPTAGTDPARAVRWAEKAVATKPNGTIYISLLGAALYRAGRLKEAVLRIEAAIKVHNGGDFNDWLFLAMAHRRLGNVEIARSYRDRAVQWRTRFSRGEAEDSSGAPLPWVNRLEFKILCQEAETLLGCVDNECASGAARVVAAGA